jgi:phage head maturation protease
MRSVLGKVIEGSAKVDGEKAIARVKFSRKPESEGAWMDIQDGIVKTLSVGYSVFRASLEDKEKKLYRATDWEPFEISMAPIPADINATVREKESKNNVEVEMIEDYQNDLDYVQTIKARYKNY